MTRFFDDQTQVPEGQRRRVSTLFALLALTALVGVDAMVGGTGRAVVGLVVAAAAAKAVLVFHNYVELGSAPRWLQAVAYTWVAGVSCLLTTFYVVR